MNLIKIDFIEYMLCTNSIQSSGQSLDPSLASQVESGACSGILLQEYLVRLDEIASLLRQYQTLVSKDVQDFAKAGRSLLDADRYLSQL